MRVVILTGEQPNQIALSSKIADRMDVAAVVLSQNIPRKRAPLAKRVRLAANGLAGRTVGRRFVRAWFAMQERYATAFTALPRTELVRVRNVNDPETLAAIAKHSPDLVVVSGTNLVGRRVIEASALGSGIVNMHTGISPYVKGGPNCTNWCLAKGWFHLIGTTVMWLDRGIDTGNVIATEQTPLTGDETLDELHWKVMEHAHDLYLRGLTRIANGGGVSSVPQDSIGDGVTFSSTEWSTGPMVRALANFDNGYRAHFADPEGRNDRTRSIKLFPLI